MPERVVVDEPCHTPHPILRSAMVAELGRLGSGRPSSRPGAETSDLFRGRNSDARLLFRTNMKWVRYSIDSGTLRLLQGLGDTEENRQRW